MKHKKILSIAMAVILYVICIFGMSLVQKTGATETSEVSTYENETSEEDYEPYGSINIQGSATIESEPNLLVIMLRIKSLDENSAKKATEGVAIKLDQLIGSLEQIGISQDDIGSSSYTINQKYDWTYYENGHRKERVFKGYEAINIVRVEIKDFDKGGKVIDVASSAGALVDSINFELSKEKRNELKIKAMKTAAEDAKLKAETIISALDEELGRVTSVSLNNYNYQPYRYWDSLSYSSLGAEEKSAAPPTTILPTDLTVSVNVNVVWDII